MKLGPGELENAESKGYSEQFTQIRFLITVEKLQPRILNEALTGPYPLFRDLLNTIPPNELDEFCNNLNKGWRFLESVPQAQAFLDSLKQWAQEWNLEADWCMERIILAMRRYYGIKTISNDFSFFYPLNKTELTENGEKYLDRTDLIFAYPILEATDVVDFSPLTLPSPPGGLPAWDPHLDPLEEGYLSRIEREARERLENDPYLSIVDKTHRNAYAKLVKNEAAEYTEQARTYANSQSGLKQVKAKPKLKTHLEWTVRVWVLGENYSQVARAAGSKSSGKKPTWKAVKKAVTEILQLIEPAWAPRLEERFHQGRPKQD